MTEDNKKKREDIRKQWKADEADVIRRKAEIKNAKEAAQKANNSEPYFPEENEDGTLNKG